MKIRKLKKIQVNSTTFEVVWDKSVGGASFNYATKRIVIGCTDLSSERLFEILLHELTEIAFIENGARYSKPTSEGYLFSCDHATFTSVMSIVAGLLPKFIGEGK